MQFAWMLCLAGVLVADSDAKKPEAVDDALRARCLKVLRGALDKGPGGTRFRAAEYLLSLDYSDGVTDAFQADLERASRQPSERIALWSLLAREAGESPRAKTWTTKIRDVAIDSKAPDQLRALEALARLRYKVPRDDLARFTKLLADGTDVVPVYADWVLLNSGQPDAERRLVDDFLKHGNEATVAAAAYVLSQISTLSDDARQTLLKTADNEAAYTSIRMKMALAAARHAQGPEQNRWIERLRDYARDGTDEQRLLAVEGLAALGRPDDVPLLSNCLVDANPDLSAAAAWALLRIGRRTPCVLGVWSWVVIVVSLLATVAVGWYCCIRAMRPKGICPAGAR